MEGPAIPTTRVLGAMLLAHQFDQSDVCIMGYVQDVRFVLPIRRCYILSLMAYFKPGE